jgi:hypothetical protein
MSTDSNALMFGRVESCVTEPRESKREHVLGAWKLENSELLTLK